MAFPIPPDDITPHDFFTRWIPQQVAADQARRTKLEGTEAIIVFELRGQQGGAFTVRIQNGAVAGEPGEPHPPDLRVRVDVTTWRQLNAGAISAPEAALKRKLKLEGNFLLGLKLHLLIGPGS